MCATISPAWPLCGCTGISCDTWRSLRDHCGHVGTNGKTFGHHFRPHCRVLRKEGEERLLQRLGPTIMAGVARCLLDAVDLSSNRPTKDAVVVEFWTSCGSLPSGPPGSFSRTMWVTSNLALGPPMLCSRPPGLWPPAG
ncbi:MAG: hypothetical protein ACLSHU_02010 [Oscillospiraceae bacterium]